MEEVVTRGCACSLLLLQPSPPWAADQSRAVAGLPRGREPESCSSLHHDCKLCHTCDKCYRGTCNVYRKVGTVTELHDTYTAEFVEWRSRRQTLIKLERLVPVDGRIEGSRLCEQNLQQRKYFKQFRLKKLSFQHYSPVLSISIDQVTGFFEPFPYDVCHHLDILYSANECFVCGMRLLLNAHRIFG